MKKNVKNNMKTKMKVLKIIIREKGIINNVFSL